MNIFTCVESIYHIFIFAQVCHNAQFYLRVVGREEYAILLCSSLFSACMRSFDYAASGFAQDDRKRAINSNFPPLSSLHKKTPRFL